MIKVHVHVLGYGRAAREVYEQALRGVGCFGHLMRGSTEFSGRVFFSGSKSVERSSYAELVRQFANVQTKARFILVKPVEITSFI